MTQLLPVIFLDIDGVLNSASWMHMGHMSGDFDDVGKRKHFDPNACAMLNRILKRVPSDIVISSAWRITHSCKWMQRALRARGVTRARVIGQTPGGGGYRGPQIQAWLDANAPRPFVIIDDSDDMGIALMPRLVRTDWKTGLLEEHIEPICQLLQQAPNV